MAKISRKILKYSKVLGKRIYQPVKPFFSPLLDKIKLVHLLGLLVVIGVAGSLLGGWRVNPQERAAWWPWSTRSHAEMAMAWFEDGDEEKALRELELANELLVIKTQAAEKSLKRAEEKVVEPGKIREEIESWEKIIKEKPYYRDVLLRLALLNYQVYNDEKAVDYFKQAEYLDPVNEEVLKVKEIISSLLF